MLRSRSLRRFKFPLGAGGDDVLRKLAELARAPLTLQRVAHLAIRFFLGRPEDMLLKSAGDNFP
jgi:hypothetical protein